MQYYRADHPEAVRQKNIMNSDFIVRAANVEDASAVARVHVDAWRRTYRTLIPKDILDNLSYEQRSSFWQTQLSGLDIPACIFIAEDPQYGLVGFASGGRNRDEPEEFEGELYAIYLREHYQRRGIGWSLFYHVAGHLRTHGIKSLIVWVLKENPFRLFYESLGGVQISQRGIRMGNADLPEAAYGWKDLSQFKG